MDKSNLIFVTMIRTRAIIKRLSHDDLVKSGIIPDLTQIINQSPSTVAVKRYPPFVYAAKDFPFFGMLLDYIIRAAFRVSLKQPFDLGQDPTIEIIQALEDDKLLSAVTSLNLYETSINMTDIVRSSLTLTSILYGNCPYSLQDLDKYVPTLVNMMKELVNKWTMHAKYLEGHIRYNTEYTHNKFSGHPDIVTTNCVLDIKTTGSFSKMSKDSSLQVLAYYALMKSTSPSLEYVGFVLPMQRELTLYNVSAWDPSQYLKLLSSEADKLDASLDTRTDIIPINIGADNRLVIIMDDNEIDTNTLTAQLRSLGVEDENTIRAIHRNISDQIIAQNLPCCGPTQTPTAKLVTTIGHHICKGANITTSLRNYSDLMPNAPCQMFLGNPRTGRRSPKTAGQIQSAANIIKDRKLKYFTHAAYVINLCAIPNDNCDHWAQRYLNEDLQLTSAMGGCGVVVHTGHTMHLPEPEALVIMEYMVRAALHHATEMCPLLLETPCNEGTEVCGKIEDLGNFFLRFTSQERTKLGVCVDTCHVFSAGYDPLLYLQHWEKYCQTPIKLVHFNDSARECGSCVDRHATPGQGHIGLDKMMAIARWCAARNIPMVCE